MQTKAVLCVVALGAMGGTGIGLGLNYALPASPLAQGLFIGERNVPEGVLPLSFLQGQRDAALSRIVRFRYEDQIFETTLGDAGVEVDVVRTLEKAKEIGHQGPLFRRLRETSRARKGQINVPFVWKVNIDKASALFQQYAEKINRPAVDARLDMQQRKKIAGQMGRELNVERSLEALEEGRHEEEETIDLVVRQTKAAVTLEDLVRVDVSKVVSTYETTFTTYGTGRGRAVNIANAAKKIDGIVIASGELFSFNDHVGPRTEENGFTLAPEIQGDETITGIGGGTCQVSSTLYAAALFATLDVPERQNHSRPSGYIKLGLDATVFYSRVDLKIRNTLPFPIMIHAYLPKPTAIRVEILGGDPVAVVAYTYGIGHTEDFTRRVYVKSYFTPGKHYRQQKGSRGYDVISLLTVRYNDGREEQRRYFSGYRPAPEVYWIAPDVDVTQLPPLPEHAIKVEGQTSSDSLAMSTYSM